ncbi:MAG: amidohydrolase family protein [Caulobacteraceae bacterium]|nr:amidohydrolase family protein [Caulobacteraceae bacterium]
MTDQSGAAVKFHIAILLALCLGPAAQAQGRGQPTVFEHVRLIDGRGGPPVDNAYLVIRDGRILSAGVGTPPPLPAEVLDLSGRTLIPGLISDHSHVGLVDGTTVSGANYTRENIVRQLRQYQAYGVTTITALGLNRSPLFDELRAEAHQGRLAGADLFGVDQGIGAPDGAPPQSSMSIGADQVFRPRTPEEAREAVDVMASRGTDLVKLWLDDLRNNTDRPPRPKMPREIYRAVIAEAHAHGLRVAAHIYDLADAKAMVASGADILAHGVRDRPVDKKFVAAVKARGVWYIPTLELDESAFIFAEHPDLLDDPVFAAALQPALRAQIADPAWRAQTLASPTIAGARKAVEINERNLKTLYDAGVNIGFGTDSGATPYRIPGWAEHLELRLMVEAGLTPAQALAIATRNAAELMHLNDRGVLAPGRRADFVVVDGDPSADIRALDRIEAVWQDGVRVAGPIPPGAGRR